MMTRTTETDMIERLALEKIKLEAEVARLTRDLEKERKRVENERQGIIKLLALLLLDITVYHDAQRLLSQGAELSLETKKIFAELKQRGADLEVGE